MGTCQARVFGGKRLASPAALRVTTDAQGRLWLLVGTDSGFEAVSTLYFTTITAQLAAR